MNTTLDTNFREKYNYEELIFLLNSNNIKEKHFAILELNEIKSQNDAKILSSNLVGQDGKIREAAAFKINEFINNPDFADFFINEEIFPILLEGIMDINGNVCRQIIDLSSLKGFDEYLCNKLPKRITKILDTIEQLDLSAKQYVVSKCNFQLYWALEALYNVVDNISLEQIKPIVIKTCEFNDYTIREKTAKIISKLDNFELNELKEKLMNDENYYVRGCFLQKK